jgi:hypothetical protein
LPSLGAPQGLLAKVAGAVTNSAVDAGEKAGAVVLAPFEPRSFRDFMLYERHAINAARGFVRTFMPRVLPITRAYEAVTGRDFPCSGHGLSGIANPSTTWATISPS